MSSDLSISVRIITPSNEMTDRVDAAYFHTKVGQIGILPRHTTLVSVLEPGIAKLKKGDKEFFYSLGKGFVTVENDQITVLTASLTKTTKE